MIQKKNWSRTSRSWLKTFISVSLAGWKKYKPLRGSKHSAVIIKGCVSALDLVFYKIASIIIHCITWWNRGCYGSIKSVANTTSNKQGRIMLEMRPLNLKMTRKFHLPPPLPLLFQQSVNFTVANLYSIFNESIFPYPSYQVVPESEVLQQY